MIEDRESRIEKEKAREQEERRGKHVKIKVFILTLCAVLLALCVPAEAQQADKIYRIGYLGSASRGFTENLAVFRQRLRELGYVEGKNLVIEWSFSKGKKDQIHERAVELADLKLDCIFITGTPAARAVKKATSSIPIVMLLVSDPVRHDLVVSLARPGGNVTGLTTSKAGLAGKRLELLKGALPRLTRVGLLRDSSRPTTEIRLRNAEVTARAMGVELQSLEVRPPFDFEDAFHAALKGLAEGLVVVPSGFRAAKHVDRIVNLAAKSRLPAIYGAPRFMHAGGLMHYGLDRLYHFRRGAEYVDKILKGAKPADLPVEQPTKFNFEINLKTARQLGITIPPEVLYQATKVIK